MKNKTPKSGVAMKEQSATHKPRMSGHEFLQRVCEEADRMIKDPNIKFKYRAFALRKFARTIMHQAVKGKGL